MGNHVERKRPIKMFRVVTAFGPYQVGAKIQPTGVYRDVLLARKLIEEVKDDPPQQPALFKEPRGRKER